MPIMRFSPPKPPAILQGILRIVMGTILCAGAPLASQAESPDGKDAARPFARSVLEYGAVGDGVADDTRAVQRALAEANLAGSILQFPAGNYRITAPLEVSRDAGRGLVLEGAGGRPINASGFSEKTPSSTTLLWDGEEGGTLMVATGVSGFVLRDLNFDGNKKAGILFLSRHVKGWGNILNMMENVHFYRAAVGIQMGSSPDEHTNSDYAFHFVTFRSLDCGLKVKNDQGVDFLFNYVFALSVKTVFDFERGGNLLVQNAQMTNCPLFLNIGGGGRNAGTFNATNVRIEWDGGGAKRRGQLLRATPKFHQASVKIVGFTDAQWAWPSNETESRHIPLMEIGAGTTVVLESSLVSGPLAALQGTEAAPAWLILRETSFSNGSPEDFIQANKNGFFRLLNNFSDKMRAFPDMVKWPDIPPKTLASGEEFSGKFLQNPIP